MSVRLTLVALATVIGLSGAAQAEMFAAGPAYGGPASVGGSINCRIFNYGLTPVSITSRQIFTNTNVLIAPAADSCNVPLLPARYCAFIAPIGGNLAYSCRIAVSGTDTQISGVAEIQAPNNSILNALPLK